jgi:Undecaprenyl-phosphate glucose phosphotransferase
LRMALLDNTADLHVSLRRVGGQIANRGDNPAVLSSAARAVAESLPRRPVSAVLFAGVVRLVEFLAILIAGALVYTALVVPTDGFDPVYVAILVGGALTGVLALQFAHGYTLHAFRRGVRDIGRIALAWSIVLALFAVVAFLTKSGAEYSRLFIATWYLGGLAAFAAIRMPLARLVRDWTTRGRFQRHAVVVGGGQAAADLIAALMQDPDNDIRICGIFDDRGLERSPAAVAGYPKLGTVAELVDFGRIAEIDLLIVSLPLAAENRLLQMLKQLWVLPVDIRLSAHTNKLRFRPRAYSFIGPVPFFDVFDRPIRDWNHVVKRAFDIFFASLALVMLSPVLLAAIVAIRLESPGPAIFRQKRYGFNNELIDVLKFRSMYTDRTDANASQLVTKNDSRVTRVGRFIRKTSIDELPQFFNVLKGELSVVGPRPHALHAKADHKLYHEAVDGYFARHRVKPGVTGWAQINGWRGETDTIDKIMQRVHHDLYYIENWSVWFDLRILFLTPFRLFSSESAY